MGNQDSVTSDPIVAGVMGRLGKSKPTANTLIVEASHDTPMSPLQVWSVFADLEKWKRWANPLVSNSRWLEGR